ncbi:hypothetical protein FX988_01511 [Paraglaciecola mesophila]|uniref:Sulfotransferase domain-containing protein n=1 Tax=Paraglaciecola mesophila TaxID=197222 RepID=A0A857JH32_9ALTE|nr:sulfotransferase [Paraglaciecola mesophila]QHJ11283.1 hypothetical protein FX988_01511 [Paraglaciecola mesophila]
MEIIKKVTDIVRAYIYKERNTKLVILGHQKAGTTAIATLLAHSANMSFSNDPIYEMSPSNSEVLLTFLDKTNDFSDTAISCPKLFFQQVVKDPDYIFSVEKVFKLYPYAKFIFIIREPHQIIRSIFNRLAISGTTELNKISCEELFEPTANWDYIINGDPTINDNMSIVERLATRIEETTLSYLKHCKNLKLIRYEDFKKNKSQYIKNTLEEMELPSCNEISGIENKQFQPKGDHKVLIEDFFGEKNYSIISQICSKTISHFGY